MTIIVSRSRTMHPQSPPLTIRGTVLKESDALDILGVRFDFKKTLRNIFTRFPEQPLKGLVNWESPGEYLKIDRFLRDASRVLCGPFWNTIKQCGERLPIHAINYYTILSVVPVFNLGCTICNIAHRWCVAELCTRFKIMCNPMHLLYGALPVPFAPGNVKHSVLRMHIGMLMRLLASEPRAVADFYSHLNICVDDLGNPLFGYVRLTGF